MCLPFEKKLAAAGDPNDILARSEGSGDITRHEDRPGPNTESDGVSARRTSPHLFEERGFGIPETKSLPKYGFFGRRRT